MSVSVSNNIKENSINFSRDSLLSNTSGWEVIRGEVTINEQLVMEAGSACRLVVNGNNMKCNYFKLLGHLTSKDNSLSTDNFNKVSMVYRIKYIDNEENEKVITDIFYPKYDFEINNKGDYTIISVPQTPITSIEITIYNSEDVEVSFVETGLFISKLVDAEDVGNIAIDAVQDALYNNLMDLVIPLIDSLPDINDVPDGAIFRCSWIEGVS